MGLLEGSGRGGKGADGTQKEVLQRHAVCQKVERGTEREGPVRGLRGEKGEHRMAGREVEGGEGDGEAERRAGDVTEAQTTDKQRYIAGRDL